ncbi:MAG: sigma-54 dependent transcriptional regulator [Pseudomonadota bacterium]
MPEAETRRVIVIDDDGDMRASLKQLLEAAGWQCAVYPRAEDLAEAEAAMSPHVVLSDVRMPGMTGTALLDGRAAGAAPIVLISAHGDIPMAVDAMQRGAYSFLEKPFAPRRLLNILSHAAEQFQLRGDAARLRARLADLSGLDRILIGASEATSRLREDVLDLSDTDANVLILGETGTGKELVARALHDLSARSGRPFVVVNCGAIAVERLDAALFGVADGPRGLIAQADGGALFLDEIGACPIESQLKLLRAIEAREITPVGAKSSEAVSFRVVAATNENLSAAVTEGRFREDLLFRLNTFVISIPPLRGRSEDISLLFQHFLAEVAKTHEASPPETTPDDLAVLLAHEWPGNVRELRHVAERRILAARRGRGSVAEAIRLEDAAQDVPDTLREAVAAFERQLIGKAIAAHHGRMDAAAEALGIGRRTLNEKIVKLGLNKDDFLG